MERKLLIFDLSVRIYSLNFEITHLASPTLVQLSQYHYHKLSHFTTYVKKDRHAVPMFQS